MIESNKSLGGTLGKFGHGRTDNEVDRLTKLAELLDKGLITKEEFENYKSQIKKERYKMPPRSVSPTPVSYSTPSRAQVPVNTSQSPSVQTPRNSSPSSNGHITQRPIVNKTYNSKDGSNHSYLWVLLIAGLAIVVVLIIALGGESSSSSSDSNEYNSWESEVTVSEPYNSSDNYNYDNSSDNSSYSSGYESNSNYEDNQSYETDESYSYDDSWD